jgi:hypothetical protein
MIMMISARILCVLIISLPVVLPLQPPQAHAREQTTHLLGLPIVTLGTTEKLYLRGADLAIINSSACSLLAQTERVECLEKLSREIALPPHPAMSPSPD